MHIFNYLTFTCDVGEPLQTKLSELGLQGWRLHTCEPIRAWGSLGSGPLEAFVVMDMVMETDKEPAAEPHDEGIAMKG